MTFYIHSDRANIYKVTNVLHICTSNDANGKRRCLIVCLDQYGQSVATFDEGENWGNLWELNESFAQWSNLHAVRINVTVSEFNRWALRIHNDTVKVSTAPKLPVLSQ